MALILSFCQALNNWPGAAPAHAVLMGMAANAQSTRAGGQRKPRPVKAFGGSLSRAPLSFLQHPANLPVCPSSGTGIGAAGCCRFPHFSPRHHRFPAGRSLVFVSGGQRQASGDRQRRRALVHVRSAIELDALADRVELAACHVVQGAQFIGSGVEKPMAVAENALIRPGAQDFADE